MSSIVKYNRGKHTYLYESVSYRDEQGKPQNTRKLVGHIDMDSGQPVYKPEYIERMAKQGVIVDSYEPPPAFSVEQIRQSDIRAYGAFYLYQALAERSGLTATLATAFPKQSVTVPSAVKGLIVKPSP